MKMWINSAVVALVSFGLTTAALAQCPGKSEGGAKAEGAGCCKKGAAAASADGKQCGDKEKCAGAAFKSCGAPQMAFKVADQTVKCPKQASELAGGDEAKIHYLLSDKEYTDKNEAMQAYDTALTSYLGEVTSVRYAVGDKYLDCPDAAAQLAKKSNAAVQFRVASYTFSDKAEAEKAAVVAKDAAGKVTVKCIKDGKEVVCDKPCPQGGAAAAEKSGCCAKKGGEVAKAEPTAEGKTGCAKTGDVAAKADGKCEFVIGDTKTCCPLTANVELAKARILAAQAAVAQFASANKTGTEVAAGV
jgi:hypothetical protein